MPCLTARARSAIRRSTAAAAVIMLACGVPAVVAAQSGTILATATVLPRPLSILDVAHTAVPGELRVRIAGCAAGALTIDARTTRTSVRIARHRIETGTECGSRALVVHLSTAVPDALDFLVSLEQSNAMLAPSFSQFVVTAREAARTSLVY